jgi:hypothetical protein
LHTRVATFVLALCLVGVVFQPIRAQQKSSSPPATPASAAPSAVLNTYCVTCHNDQARTGGLSLEKADLSSVAGNAETWEKVIRKLRVGMMPPPGMPRPDKATLDGFASFFETSIDRAAAAKPNPGHVVMHRLNRAEYENVIRDLLALDIDSTALLPPDDESSGFDNIADVLKVSPSLMERYLSASWNITRMAVGNTGITPSTSTYRVRPDLSQDQHIDGMPLGTRGGILVNHNFPLDGEYIIKVRLWRNTFDLMRGMEDAHQIEISMDGQRLQLVKVGGQEDFAAMAENPGTFGADLDRRLTVRIPVKAGVHTLSAATILRSHAQRDNLIKPFMKTTIDGLDITGDPSVDRLTVEGPYGQTSPGDTPSRRRIFTCKPATAAEEEPCARKILSSLARLAYRRPLEDTDVDMLMDFYRKGRAGHSFDSGVESALQYVLASPEFLFRFEGDPPGTTPGTAYRLKDLALASRLEQQVKRMLGDPRSNALIANFAEQWLHLRNLKSSAPDLEAFPDFDDNLRQAMKQETTLLFDSILREDRSVMDLLSADYTFVNERLARHYGMPNIYGSQFRRVKVPSDARRGLLGQASILTVTSYPNRTSPVERGKWILTNLLGVPPQPPPPNVPPLKEESADGKPRSLRESMEAHRANPVCAGCHKAMDPIGFSMENFDGVGHSRTSDHGTPIDSSGTLFNGAKVDGIAGLRQMLLGNPDVFVGVMTEKMLTYALGRGITYHDMPAVRKIVQDSRTGNFRFSALVTGVVKSTPFQFKEAK